MGLEFDEAKDHLHARAFEVSRPDDIRSLVETGLQFDQGGNGFASLRCLDESADDRAVLRGTVERLFDRDHIRIGGGLPDELHHDVERLIRMVDDDVLRTDRGKAIAAVIADALRETRIVRSELPGRACRPR